MQPVPSYSGFSAYLWYGRPDSSHISRVDGTWRLHFSQIIRTRRCASTQFRHDTKLYGSTPMFRKRPITSTTLFAWTVVNTRWPVSADCTAIAAVVRD